MIAAVYYVLFQIYSRDSVHVDAALEEPVPHQISFQIYSRDSAVVMS